MIYNYYQITNLVNQKVYIGITEKTIEKRYKIHRQLLQSNNHPNYYLQADWNKYGENNFQLSLIESKEYDDIEEGYYHEFELISTSSFSLYNIQPGGIVNPIKNKDSYEKMVRTKQSQVPNIYALEEISENTFKIAACYPSQKAAGRAQPNWSQANIQKALHNHHKSYGYFWVEEKNIDNNLQDWKPGRLRMRPTALLDEDNTIVEVHHNPRVFELINNYRAGAVSASICHKTKCFGKKYQYISEQEYYKRVPVILIK